MQNKILTIIIPSYNMEKYLSRCLNTLCIPSILKELEIIIVNDGSKDKTLLIAEQYRSRFSDTIVLIDKPNGNYGSCVNRGLKEASGKYFRILDADDMVNSEGLEKMIEVLRFSETDLVITDYTRENLFKNKIQKVSTQDKGIIYGKAYSIEDIDIFEKGIENNFVMHSMTYKTKVLKDLPLQHQEGISYTDTEYCYYPIKNIQNVLFLDVYLYRYQLGRDGQTMSKESFMKNRDHLYQILIRMLDENKKFPLKNTKKQKVRNSVLITTTKFYYYIILCHVGYNRLDDEKLRIIENKLRENIFVYNQLEEYKSMGLFHIVKKYRKSQKYSNGFPFRQLYNLSNFLKI